MKTFTLLAGAALLCGTAFAQQEPPGGAPAARAEMKVDAKKSMGTPMSSGAATATPMASGTGSASPMGMSMGMKAMDTNGDGMISKREWDRHHSMMWNKMKNKMKNGMVPMADVEAMMNGGPN